MLLIYKQSTIKLIGILGIKFYEAIESVLK